MSAVPKATQAVPHAIPYSILTGYLSAFLQHPSYHRRPDHILLLFSEGSTKRASLQYSQRPSLSTEQEKLTGGWMIVILLLKYYIRPWFDNYRETYYSHSFYLQSVLYPIKYSLMKQPTFYDLYSLTVTFLKNHLLRTI